MRSLVRLVASFALAAVACSEGPSDDIGNPGPPTSGAGGQAGMGGTGGTAGASGTGATAGSLACESVQPGIAPLRLLTHLQYDNTVADLLGDTSRPAQGFPAENEVLGYSNNVNANQVVPRLIEAFQTAAESLAERAVTTRLDTIAPCAAGSDQTACGRAFVREFGTRAFRRPLDEAEAVLFDRLFDAMLPQGYAHAVELTLRAILQSPQFVYRVDAMRAPTPETGAVALGSYELAARLSYFLTNSTPDPQLLAAAAAGQLSGDADLELQARRLLETPRAREMAQDFMGQWLGVQRLDGAAREAADVPHGPTDLVADLKLSLSAFLADTVFTQGTMRALFTSNKVFVTPKLAPLYGAVAPAEGLAEFTAPERTGLITQPGLMALFAHSDQSAPVLRGAFVRERLMCLVVDPPPPEVNAIAPDVDPNATTRQRFAQHTESPTCAGCHTLLDGIGFTFERFDQFGRYREFENGLPVDQSGEVIDTGDPLLDGVVGGASELATRMAESPVVRDCVATQWYRYAMGRVEETGDTCSLADAKARFAASQGNFRELLLGIVMSEAFRYRPAVTGGTSP
jgi:hypothetical protein